MWNLHASLLPEFRGASPVQAAILAGKEYTGVTVMRTELALDSGDILLAKRLKIGNMTAGELSVKLSELAADCAAETLDMLEKGFFCRTKAPLRIAKNFKNPTVK